MCDHSAQWFVSTLVGAPTISMLDISPLGASHGSAVADILGNSFLAGAAVPAHPRMNVVFDSEAAAQSTLLCMSPSDALRRVPMTGVIY
jgi:hypothetical protein